MDISPSDLRAEYLRASKEWPQIFRATVAYGLPWRLLIAIGSRETNLRNEVGDGGHGHGIFQLDDRSHRIPAGFDSNIALQCDTAASMLRSLLNSFGDEIATNGTYNWRGRYPNERVARAAMAAYNAGSGTVRYNLAHGLSVDHGTAHGDYSLDVWERMVWLEENTEAHPVTYQNGYPLR